MTLKIVQTVNKITTSTGVSTSNPIILKSGHVRVATAGTGVYVDIGSSPSASTNSLYVPSQSAVVLKERVTRQTISGITTGSSTIITVDPQIGTQFTTSDYLAIENVIPAGINTNFAQVTGITEGTITINWNTSSITGVVTVTGATVSRAVKVAGLTVGGPADLSITEVQVAGGA
jgi:hypothetical protein